MLKVYLMIGSAIVIFGWGLWTKHLVEEVATQEQALEATNRAFNTYAQNVNEEVADYAKRNHELEVEYQKAQTIVTEVSQKLAKHDLTKLFKAKPKLMERRINAATASLLHDITVASGGAESPKPKQTGATY